MDEQNQDKDRNPKTSVEIVENWRSFERTFHPERAQDDSHGRAEPRPNGGRNLAPLRRSIEAFENIGSLRMKS